MMDFFKKNRHLAPVILRIFFGAAFIVAGLDKLLSLSMAKGMFGMLFGAGLSWLVYVAIAVELAGGLMLLFNRKVRATSLVLSLFIVVALVVTFKLGDSANFVGTLREMLVMNTGGGNTPVNLAFLAGLLSLAFGAKD